MSKDVQWPTFTDGEEVSHVDANRIINDRRVLEGDMRLGSLLHKANPGDFLDPYPNGGLYASGFGGTPYPGAGNLEIGNHGGLIHQYIASTIPDDEAPKLLSYWLASDELATTLSVGDGTDPRIDLIQVKLSVDNDADENRDFEDATTGEESTTSMPRRDKVLLQFSTKEGTPAPTPTAPTPDTGYVAWCYVWVPQSYNAPFATIEISDMRYPLGYKRVLVQPSTMLGGASFTNWPLQNTAGFPRKSGGASETLYFNCPVTDPCARLLAVHVHADADVDFNMFLLNPHSPGTPTQIYAGTGARSFRPAAPASPIVPAAWWCGGSSCGRPTLLDDEAQLLLHCQIVAVGANTNVYGVSFVFAGGV